MQLDEETLYLKLVAAAEEAGGFVSEEAQDLLQRAAEMIADDPRSEA